MSDHVMDWDRLTALLRHIVEVCAATGYGDLKESRAVLSMVSREVELIVKDMDGG